MKIVGVGQILDLEGGGGVSNKMVVRTEDGAIHDVPILEETAQALLSLVAGDDMRKAEEPEYSDYPEADASMGDSFADPGEVSGAAVMGAVAEEEVMVPPQPSGLGQRQAEDEDGVQL